MKPLFCVRHQASAPLGIMETVLDETKQPWRYLDVWRAFEMPQLSECAGLIVLGGEMNVDRLADYAFLKSVRNLVANAVDEDVPVLGICLGAQILTRALGGSVAPAPTKEIGFKWIRSTPTGSTDPVLSAFAPERMVFQFHEDECELPPGTDLLLTGEGVKVQGFRVAGRRAWGVQFHFEVTEREVDAWCTDTPDLVDSWGASKEAVVTQAREHLGDQFTAGADTTRRFLAMLD